METTARLQFARFIAEMRRAYRVTFAALRESESERMSDVRLFAMTFAGGFLFTTLFIA
ncbi:hypothetical protein WJS89_03835 [Sphingomicrobium sp. XHP0235]|uniref:hypothetical protein n=1 Tax=Sphingomicrobium aquimarinum TaxID=3133971 RepID=UPI0031FEAF41